MADYHQFVAAMRRCFFVIATRRKRTLAAPRGRCDQGGDGADGGSRPPSSSWRLPRGSASSTDAGVPGPSGQAWMPPRGLTRIVTVRVASPYSMVGGAMRPTTSVPPLHSLSQTRMWSSVVPGAGSAKAGSRAQVAGPYPVGAGDGVGPGDVIGTTDEHPARTMPRTPTKARAATATARGSEPRMPVPKHWRTPRPTQTPSPTQLRYPTRLERPRSSAAGREWATGRGWSARWRGRARRSG